MQICKSLLVLCFVVPVLANAQEEISHAIDFVGKTQDVRDFEHFKNGLKYKESFGRWLSRENGKLYTITIYVDPSTKRPEVVALTEMRDKFPGKSVYGIENVVYIRAAADVKYSGKLDIRVDAGDCIPEMGNAHLWTPKYNIISIVRKMDKKHPKNEHERDLIGKGFEEFAEQAWFLDADNARLISLNDEEINMLICRDRKW